MAEADSSSEELYDEATWVFYKDRIGWKDVTPVPQDDGPHPIVAIAYSEKFRDVYDHFRAILELNEKSERALELTKDALNLNPANYTVWQYRREILKHLNKNLIEELEYVQEMIEENPKNYQVWHHRRVIVEWLGDPSHELELTKFILQQDSKNYHAWEHRQWVIRTFSLFSSELEHVDKLLSKDIRNNSAWNQRYFVINHTTGFTPEVVEREVKFTLQSIEKVTHNESSWNYLRGVLLHHTSGGLSDEPNVNKTCEKLYSSGCRSPFLLAFLIDMCEEKLERGEALDKNKTLQYALQLCDDLANEYDTIRNGYWNYIAAGLSDRFNNMDSAAIDPVQ